MEETKWFEEVEINVYLQDSLQTVDYNPLHINEDPTKVHTHIRLLLVF